MDLTAVEFDLIIFQNQLSLSFRRAAVSSYLVVVGRMYWYRLACMYEKNGNY